jgi:hypothetical protein
MAGMSGEFLLQVFSTFDGSALELLRDQLLKEACAANVNWQSRVEVYKKIQVINERLMQLDDPAEEQDRSLRF